MQGRELPPHNSLCLQGFRCENVLQALTRVNPWVYESVAALCDSPDTTVVVFSGSDKQKLEETFGGLDVWLAAENGIFMRPPEGDWSTLLEVSLAWV